MLQGYTELLELLRQHREHKGYNLPVDVYGTGEDLEAIKARAEDYQLELSFKGARDHLDDSIHPYRSSRASPAAPSPAIMPSPLSFALTAQYLSSLLI